MACPPAMRHVLAVLILFGASAGEAYGLDSCAGRYSSALLKPLAQPAIVALDLADSSDVPSRLAASFTSGLQQAGLAVAGTPTIRLRLSYQVTGQGGGDSATGGLNQGGGAVTGWSTWSGGSAAALQGGQSLALPISPTTTHSRRSNRCNPRC